ncbi:MAG TPA: CBS domain-containing protein [Candidatus Atribacteria bacterium]|nr:CBS domain-containing protein [Candidatus Atribacteria bacterium]
MKVRDVMRRDLTSIPATMKIGRVIELMERMRISELIITDRDFKVKGIVTDGIILKAALPRYFSYLDTTAYLPDLDEFAIGLKDLSKKEVGTIMLKDIYTIYEDTKVLDLIDVMIGRRLKILPVVDNEGKLVGIVDRPSMFKKALIYEEKL